MLVEIVIFADWVGKCYTYDSFTLKQLCRTHIMDLVKRWAFLFLFLRGLSCLQVCLIYSRNSNRILAVQFHLMGICKNGLCRYLLFLVWMLLLVYRDCFHFPTWMFTCLRCSNLFVIHFSTLFPSPSHPLFLTYFSYLYWTLMFIQWKVNTSVATKIMGRILFYYLFFIFISDQ